MTVPPGSSHPKPRDTPMAVRVDPRITEGLGQSHSLASAVADLVDNSLDVGARNVLVQFVHDGESVLGIDIVDDGQGMDESGIDRAMDYGGQKEYERSSLGHFGVGLKAASLSQGDELSVFSRKAGFTPQGRFMSNADREVVYPYAAVDVMEAIELVDTPFTSETGTLVSIRKPTNLLSGADTDELHRWLSNKKTELELHLGLVHHRVLSSGRCTLWIGEFDSTYGEAGIPDDVEPYDPFGYERSGDPRFPLLFHGGIDGIDFSFTAHVWPETGRRDPNFLLGSTDGFDRQGLYVYRNDRLLQAGGWSGLKDMTDERRFLRLEIDVPEALGPYARMNPEKQGVSFTQPFRQAILNAHSFDGTGTFDDALEASAHAAARAKKRTRQERRIVRPASGLPRSVVDALEEHVGFDRDAEPVDVVWETLPPSRVFRIDPVERLLVLNRHYHADLTGLGRRGTSPKPAGKGQAPLTTTLLFLLAGPHFSRSVAGKLWEEDQRRLQRVVRAALETQREWEDKVFGVAGPENAEDERVMDHEGMDGDHE